MGRTILFLIMITTTTLYISNAYKILIISPTPSKSHIILTDALVKHLSEAGHEITYVTIFLPVKPQPNVTVVDISDIFPSPEVPINIKDVMGKTFDAKEILFLLPMFLELSRLTLENLNVQKLMADKNQRFDVVIAEWLFNDIYAGFAGLYNCPLIWFSPVEPHWMVMQLVDESPNPAYSVDIVSDSIPPLTFKQRFIGLGSIFFGNLLQYFYVFKFDNDLYEKHFVPIIRSRQIDVPPFETLRNNGSLVLSNSHVSMGIPVRVPQNFKPIGGFHIDINRNPLSRDLQTLMDDAKYGVIYFSMGSNLRSKHFPDDIKQGLLDMFGQLNETVLWKFEEDLPNRPRNVHILHWAPQQTILGHKNCKLFITHGGLLSTTETIHFGVPIIGIPVFGDQFINIERSVKKGFAKKVVLSYNIVADLKLAIQEILMDPNYTIKAKELSEIYHDRPMHPGKELVYWVEHVVKTRGAPHLRSPAFLVPWYQKLYLDLALVLFSLLLLLKYVLTFTFRSIKSKLFTREKQKLN